MARIDTLLHPAIEGEAGEPPVSPDSGDCWLVAEPASGAWQGHEAALASWDGIQWTFCLPVEGLIVLDRATGARLAYRDGWNRSARPTAPSGGSVVDSEARAAIIALTDMLATLTLIPSE